MAVFPQPVLAQVDQIDVEQPVLDGTPDDRDAQGPVEVLGKHGDNIDLHCRKSRTGDVSDRPPRSPQLDLDAGKSLWARYAEGTAGRDPVEFLDVAIERTDGRDGRNRLAIDLGSGAGNEALALLAHGWRVLAVDGEPRAIETLESRVPDAHAPQLETRISDFADLDLPTADLVFASLSLPFAGVHLEGAVRAALEAVGHEGWFVGVLFGVNDAWASEPGIAVVRSEQIEAWLSGFGHIEIKEEEFDGPSGSGPKHWHWYVVSAQRTES